MLEIWIIDLGESSGVGFLFLEERKWARASWVARIGCVRLMSRMA